MSWEERMKQKTVALSLFFIACLVSLGVVEAGSPLNAQDKKPNILIIWGDDIGLTNISAYTMGLVGYSLLTGLDALRGRIGSSVRQRNDP